jgi:hypothetical protein
MRRVRGADSDHPLRIRACLTPCAQSLALLSMHIHGLSYMLSLFVTWMLCRTASKGNLCRKRERFGFC